MSAQTVLVVEDEPRIAAIAADYLRHAGYAVIVARDGLEALRHVGASHPDLVVLDLGLPGVDGLEVARTIRASSSLPIIMVTARAEETDRIMGLEIGADDYISKPFSPNELIARIRALVRRTKRSESEDTRLTLGSLSVDLSTHTISDDGRDVKLTAKEFMLLRYFLQHRGRVLSRDLLLGDVWGYRYTGGTRTVDVHIRRLREKLPVLVDRLVTVKQFGYKLIDEDGERES